MNESQPVSSGVPDDFHLKPSVEIPQEIGNYRIFQEIGAGGMGHVYRAIHLGLDRAVALKVLPTGMAQDSVLIERFRREAKAAAALEHENIVTVYDQGEASGHYYLAMEYVDGGDLSTLIRVLGQIPVAQSVGIVEQAARGLGHAHARGIVHRDIKPSNLLIRRDGVVKIADMGLALRRQTEHADDRLTRPGSTLGTVDYMSPEQARGSDPIDARSDIYSLGCTWFHMLTGQPPFSEGSLYEKLRSHIEQEPPDPTALNTAVPDSVVKILDCMLEKKPQDRFQSADELLADLKTLAIEREAPKAEVDEHPLRLKGIAKLVDAADHDTISLQGMTTEHPTPSQPGVEAPWKSRTRELLGQFVRDVTAAGQLAAAQTEHMKITQFSLPRAYATLGSALFAQDRYRNLSKHYVDIRMLQSKIEELEADERASSEVPKRGVAEATAKRLKAKANVQMLKKQLESAFGRLGEQAFEVDDRKCGPVELTNPVASLRRRLSELDAEIQKLEMADNQRLLSSRTLTIAVLVMLLLLVLYLFFVILF